MGGVTVLWGIILSFGEKRPSLVLRQGFNWRKSSMRLLIIGGTGLISTGITRLLVERGDEVVLYNRGRRTSQIEGAYETIIGDRKDFTVSPFSIAA